MIFLSRYVNLFLFIYFNMCICYFNNKYYSIPYIKKKLPRTGLIGFNDIYNSTNNSNNNLPKDS